MGHGVPGLVTVLMRVVFVLFPLAYIFVIVMGLPYLSLAVSTVTSAFIYMVISIIWIEYYFKKLNLS